MFDFGLQNYIFFYFTVVIIIKRGWSMVNNSLYPVVISSHGNII